MSTDEAIIRLERRKNPPNNHSNGVSEHPELDHYVRQNIVRSIVFLAVFALFLFLALVGIALPPAPWLLQEFISDILQTDYATLVEGIINGLVYGAIVYLIFAIIMAISDGTNKPKRVDIIPPRN